MTAAITSTRPQRHSIPDPLVWLLDGYRVELAADLDLSAIEPGMVVRSGFVSDLLSIPRWLWWWMPPHGRGRAVGLGHDDLYRRAGIMRASNGKIYDRQAADMFFARGQRIAGESRTRARLQYIALRHGGGRAWRICLRRLLRVDS